MTPIGISDNFSKIGKYKRVLKIEEECTHYNTLKILNLTIRTCHQLSTYLTNWGEPERASH